MTDVDQPSHPEPPLAGNEVDALLGSLERQRASLAWKCGGLDHLGRLVTPDGERPSLRRILIDLVEEYARHVGHADLIREAVDGLTGEDPTDNPYPYRHAPS
jgi:hypothetical protein